MTSKRFAHTALLDFLHKRILELRPYKTQAEISYAAGFRNPSMLANIKNGNARLPIDRVSPLADALGVDPRRLLLLALEQHSEGTLARSFDAILGTIVSANELAWIEEIRIASGNTDPAVTSRSRTALRAIFGK